MRMCHHGTPRLGLSWWGMSMHVLGYHSGSRGRPVMQEVGSQSPSSLVGDTLKRYDSLINRHSYAHDSFVKSDLTPHARQRKQGDKKGQLV
jgi:hypothetical protein